MADLMKNMECHFNWQLDCSRSRLENVHQDLQDRLHTGCTWMCQLKNLLGYVLHSLGSSAEALTCLREAEKMIKEQKRDAERHCLLLVNQANLAWVHYLRGELEESQAYLKEVTRLQEAFPAPPGCQIHPELSGQKGWSLLKFERSHKKAAIECFEIALIDKTEQRSLAKKAIPLYKEVITPHSYKNIILADLHAIVGDVEAADQIYRSLLGKEENLSGVEKQLLYRRYGFHLFRVKRE
ncbi:interferon-induced protein with tetratricopeptide repeats 1-like [Sardina pilchardus]|uniref:interferon-induced protein with tetratricopeptide repeats 1-like n=1 Tax=Sardina pilchardus TaxID=27697 RepID=UPI002E1627F4